MAKKMKNKMKHWRKMGNQVALMVPRKQTITGADGVEREEEVVEPHLMTGRQYKMYTAGVKLQEKLLNPLQKELFFRAGLVTINHEVEIKGAVNEVI